MDVLELRSSQSRCSSGRRRRTCYPLSHHSQATYPKFPIHLHTLLSGPTFVSFSSLGRREVKVFLA